ncbi:MAG: hypothetical protein ACYDBV_00700 [Nitrospiria bacterium]
MKTTILLVAITFLPYGGVFSPRGIIAEERIQTDKDLKEDSTPLSGKKNQERKEVLRESEILGTLEKPQISTELPWKDPEGLDVKLAPLHRSFIKEIFRPVAPLKGPIQETK